MKERKKALRKDMQKRLSEMTPEVRTSETEQIRQKLFETDIWKQATTVGVTVSRGNEIDTYPIIEKAWSEGKTVAVPKCNVQNFSMDFRKIQSFNQLEVVYFGLREPIVEKTEQIEPNQMDLLLVPGLLFDKSGYRVGFGGGFYDRYLERFNGPTVSLLHSVQLHDGIPRESFDQPVDFLIFPDRVHQTRGFRNEHI